MKRKFSILFVCFAAFVCSQCKKTISTETVHEENSLNKQSLTVIASNTTIYADGNYAGTAVTLNPGTYTTAQLSALGFGNNSASSIKIPKGVVVTMYDGDNLTGTSWRLSSDTPSFFGLSPSSANDKMSSCKVELGASVFSSTNYAGTTATLTPGYYTTAALASFGITDNSISSVYLPAGIRIFFWRDDNFSGTSWPTFSSKTDLGGSIRGLISSCKVEFIPNIMLKLDDLGSNNFGTFKPVMDTLVARKIKASFGIIAAELTSSAPTNLAPYIAAQNADGEKLFEFWHHGYDHSSGNPPNNNNEFSGTPYSFQLTHFNDANQIVLSQLGIQMHSFGPPFNTMDSNTDAIIRLNSNYKVIMFGPGASRVDNGIMYLNNRVDMEGSDKVNYDYFITQYNAKKATFTDNMVLQGHAGQWDATKRAEFIKILNFLTSQGCTFTTPYNYYLANR